MAKRPNDDLFAGTTMTFGEHLEELRACLFKALIGLVIGVLAGMLIANHVVRWIQAPLSQAIERYYVETSVKRLEAEYGTQLPLEVLRFMVLYRVTFEETFIERPEIERVTRSFRDTDEGKEKRVASSDDLTAMAEKQLPVPSPEMVKVRTWKPMRIGIRSLNAQEVFMIWMKASFVTGLVMSSPWVFYQIWLFVAAGLYPHEKNYIYVYLPFSIGLFLAGASTAFFFVFEPVLDFLFSFNQAMNIDPEPRISEWIGFVLFLPIGFGVSFQLPLVMLFVNRLGIASVELYLSKWRIAILSIFVISAVLTPADPVSMMFMAGPLTILYFLGVLLCRYMPRGRNPYAEVYEP